MGDSTDTRVEVPSGRLADGSAAGDDETLDTVASTPRLGGGSSSSSPSGAVRLRGDDLLARLPWGASVK